MTPCARIDSASSSRDDSSNSVRGWKRLGRRLVTGRVCTGAGAASISGSFWSRASSPRPRPRFFADAAVMPLSADIHARARGTPRRRAT